MNVLHTDLTDFTDFLILQGGCFLAHGSHRSHGFLTHALHEKDLKVPTDCTDNTDFSIREICEICVELLFIA